MFEWKPYSQHASGPPTVYCWEGKEVARLFDRINGTWFVELDRQRPYEQRRMLDCQSYDSGRRGVELWAERHRERLIRECEQRWAEYLRTQTWRR